MNDQSPGLVDDDKVVVLVNDIKWDILGDEGWFRFNRQRDIQYVVDAQPAARLGRRVVQFDVVFDRPLPGGPAEVGIKSAEIVVNSPTMGAVFNDDANRLWRSRFGIFAEREIIRGN